MNHTGLRDRNSPTCTFSQNGYGANMSYARSLRRAGREIALVMPKAPHHPPTPRAGHGAALWALPLIIDLVDKLVPAISF